MIFMSMMIVCTFPTTTAFEEGTNNMRKSIVSNELNQYLIIVKPCKFIYDIIHMNMDSLLKQHNTKNIYVVTGTLIKYNSISHKNRMIIMIYRSYGSEKFT